MVDWLLKGLVIEPISRTRLAKIHFYSVDPAMAAKVANAVVAAYIEQNLEMKIDSLHGASEFLNKKIEEQKKKLEES